jgi:hypothetical protein
MEKGDRRLRVDTSRKTLGHGEGIMGSSRAGKFF